MHYLRIEISAKVMHNNGLNRFRINVQKAKLKEKKPGKKPEEWN